MINVQKGLGLKNISDLVVFLKKKDPMKEQKKKYIRNESEIKKILQIILNISMPNGI